MPSERGSTRRMSRGSGLLVTALAAGAIGLLLTIGGAIVSLRVHPAAVVTGRETIRFPDASRCGISVRRRHVAGGFDITLQTGAILRVGSEFDAKPGHAEAIVPLWLRDRLVPWGWDGPWAMGQRSMRHVVLRGWPWPAFYAILEARTDGPNGSAGWTVIEGSAIVPGTPPSPWDPALPPLWPTAVHLPALLADVAVQTGLAAIVILAAAALVAAVRRGVRRRRGLCPACGYPRPAGGGGGCPECGSGRPAAATSR